MDKITGIIKIDNEKWENIKESVVAIKDYTDEIEKNLNEDTSDLLDILMIGANTLGASDIHLEPEEDEVVLRLRLDGVLQKAYSFDFKKYKFVLSRIKLLSKLKLNISNKAQDGRFSVLMGDTQIEIRTSSIPSEYGESVVMRILNPESLVEVEQLGIREDTFKTFTKEISQPNGMIIATGPTGSGKTTTLYAILKKLQNPEIKIITIEDPIEYHLKGISQTQVNKKKGYDFATGLRAIVRQDPDVILVGEIRDLETANIAIQAALTGHLVLTTLHTNDAAGTIVRLQALGEKTVNIAPTINLAIGQRLLRKVCGECSTKEKPTSEELEMLKSQLPDQIIDEDTEIPKAHGCDKCNSGYRGRLGIFEFFQNDETMKNAILTSPSISELRETAKKNGMITMRQDGLLKVLEGLTTIEEINRVTKQ